MFDFGVQKYHKTNENIKQTVETVSWRNKLKKKQGISEN